MCLFVRLLIPGFCAFIFQTNFDHITVTIPVAATAQVRLLAQTVSCLLPWGEPADKYCSSAANCAGKELCGEAPSGLRAYDTMLTPQLENSSPRASALKRARPGDLRLVCDTPTCFSQPRLLSCALGQTPWPRKRNAQSQTGWDTRGGTRTHNILLRREAPYPSGHKSSDRNTFGNTFHDTEATVGIVW